MSHTEKGTAEAVPFSMGSSLTAYGYAARSGEVPLYGSVFSFSDMRGIISRTTGFP